MKRMAMGLLVLLAACATPAAQAEPEAPRPAQAPAFDPVGTWDITTVIEGSEVAGTVFFRRGTDGVLSAEISTPMTGAFNASATLEGRRATLRSATPQGNLSMNITFDEQDGLSGNWSLDSGMGGTVTGRRRRS